MPNIRHNFKDQVPEDFPENADGSFDSLIIHDEKELDQFIATNQYRHFKPPSEADGFKFPMLISSRRAETYGYHRFDGLSLERIVELLEEELGFYKAILEGKA